MVNLNIAAESKALETQANSTYKNSLDSRASNFARRHIGIDEQHITQMLQNLGIGSLDELIDKTVPEAIRLHRSLKLPAALSESAALAKLKAIASNNQVYRSYIGLGYANCVTPPVIQRNILENPGWYTSYTPYQAEIAQGRLEALLNYQTAIVDLTGLEIANSSLLDEGTAAAEAMSMSYGVCKTKANAFFVDAGCHPQTIEVVKTRALPLGIEVIVDRYDNFDFSTPIFGALLQYPATDGTIHDYYPFIERVHEAKALATVAADILSLALLTPPGEFGAPKDSAFPWVMAVLTQPILRPKRNTKDRFQGALSACLKTLAVNPPCVWHYKPENNIFVGKKLPATSVPLRYYWR